MLKTITADMNQTVKCNYCSFVVEKRAAGSVITRHIQLFHGTVWRLFISKPAIHPLVSLSLDHFMHIVRLFKVTLKTEYL